MKNEIAKKMKEELRAELIEERINFGQNLRTRRRILDLTQDEVAEAIGITTTAYSKIERGESGVTFDRIKQIASVLGIDTPELVSNVPTGTALMKDIYVGMINIKQQIEKISMYLAAEEAPVYKTKKRWHKKTKGAHA